MDIEVKKIKIIFLIISLLIFIFIAGSILKQKPAEVQHPQIISTVVEPIKVRPGDIMTISAEIEDNLGVSRVTGDMGGIETINLSLTGGTVYKGIWSARWSVHDTEVKGYNTTITAFNSLGEISSVTIMWSDPSWNTSGGDHMGTDWYPATDNASQNISGYHYNISTFGINASQIVNVTPYSLGGGSLTINATYINISGTLNASGSGFNGSAIGVNGSGPGSGSGSTKGGGGGAYGGNGGTGGGSKGGGGGTAYGSNANMSIEMGSGGGGGGSGAGGAGGGIIILNATALVSITGVLSVNGTDSENPSSDAGGGGSGGGILIRTDGTANISGMLYANGGTGGNVSSTNGGGGGGGGRIKVFAGINNTNSATSSVTGGAGGVGNNGNGVNGNPGSITFVSWESYNDSTRITQDDIFTIIEPVYLKGTGLNASYSWDVAYYQGNNSLYNVTRNQSITSGYLNLSINPNGTTGTWHSIIYANSTFWSNINPGNYYIPQNYTENDTNMSGFDCFTVISLPDLVITKTNISFSYSASDIENGEAKENATVTINASVYNSGGGNASNVKVSFFDGAPGSNNNIANATITSIAANSSQNATIYWNSLIGTHNISVKVDPDNNITESNETNNNASRLINVSAWQKYYGNVSGELSLRNQQGNYFNNWTWGELDGNVYITNIPYLNFSHLQALGRNKTGGLAQNNFSRVDELLNMTLGSNNATSFTNNNITQLFSLDGTNPRNTTSFTVYGTKINNVAIVNSTNTTNFTSVENATFITGILWDTTNDKDGVYGNDGENLVFITRINAGKTGLTGSPHDYEVAIPSRIGNASIVYAYVELK